jgi:hypothetical protein
MPKIILPILTISLIALYSCEPENGDSVFTYGQDTLSSDPLYTGDVTKIQGFDFSADVIRFEELTQSPRQIDITIQPTFVSASQGQELGAILTLDGVSMSFQSMGPGFLADITEAPESGYIPEVEVHPGYCYCVITGENHYAKFYIIDLQVGVRPSSQPYAWISFNWEYQPDGSRFFN